MPLMDQNYHNVLIFFLLWSIASNFASPFFSIYMLENLELSYFYITSMNMIASVARIAASNLWGRFADSCSWKLVTLGSIYMLGLAYIGLGLLTKENCSYWLPVVQAVSGAAWGGINIATFRMQFAFAPVEHRISYVSFCSTMVGWLCRFFFIHAWFSICSMGKKNQYFKYSHGYHATGLYYISSRSYRQCIIQS